MTSHRNWYSQNKVIVDCFKSNYLLAEECWEKVQSEDLEAVGGWKPNTVTGPQQWVTYSAMLTSSLSSGQMIRDFATFIYCKLNHPDSKDY